MKRRGISRIVSLYVAWLIAAVMLGAAVTSPPAINLGLSPRTSRYRAHNFRSHRYGRSYYSQRNDFYTLKSFEFLTISLRAGTLLTPNEN